jgi:hypothetical protein
MKDEFEEFMRLDIATMVEDIFTEKYIHSVSSVSGIIDESTRIAQESPEVKDHKTYIVSFPARIVTVVTIDKGMVTCFDRGYMEKKAG